MSYVFFPGCSLEGTARDFHQSTMAVAEALGLALPEIPDWICCGSTAAHQSDPVLALALPAKSLLAAEGKTVVACCAACYSRLKTANHEISRDAATRRKVAEALGRDYDGQTPVAHLLEVLVRDVGLAAIAARVKRPLEGLKVACYYGCLITRPSLVTGAEHPEYPMKMDYLMRSIGAEPVDWSAKTNCCGGSLGVTQTEVALEMTKRILTNARDCGADVVATMCPMCHMNLDMRQQRLEFDSATPILHVPQLMLLAFGMGERSALLDKAMTDSRPLLRKKGLLQLST